MVSDEAIPYSQSLEKLNAIEAGIRYAERTFYAKGREEGLLEAREEGFLEAREEGFIEGRNESIRIMASLGIPAETIASKFGMSKHDVDGIIRSKA